MPSAGDHRAGERSGDRTTTVANAAAGPRNPAYRRPPTKPARESQTIHRHAPPTRRGAAPSPPRHQASSTASTTAPVTQQHTHPGNRTRYPPRHPAQAARHPPRPCHHPQRCVQPVAPGPVRRPSPAADPRGVQHPAPTISRTQHPHRRGTDTPRHPAAPAYSSASTQACTTSSARPPSPVPPLAAASVPWRHRPPRRPAPGVPSNPAPGAPLGATPVPPRDTGVRHGTWPPAPGIQRSEWHRHPGSAKAGLSTAHPVVHSDPAHDPKLSPPRRTLDSGGRRPPVQANKLRTPCELRPTGHRTLTSDVDPSETNTHWR